MAQGGRRCRLPRASAPVNQEALVRGWAPVGGELHLLAVLGWTVACFVEDEIPGAFGAPLG